MRFEIALSIRIMRPIANKSLIEFTFFDPSFRTVNFLFAETISSFSESSLLIEIFLGEIWIKDRNLYRKMLKLWLLLTNRYKRLCAKWDIWWMSQGFLNRNGRNYCTNSNKFKSFKVSGMLKFWALSQPNLLSWAESALIIQKALVLFVSSVINIFGR